MAYTWSTYSRCVTVQKATKKKMHRVVVGGRLNGIIKYV